MQKYGQVLEFYEKKHILVFDYFEILLLYWGIVNFVMVSGEQQNNSAILIQVSILLQSPSIPVATKH